MRFVTAKPRRAGELPAASMPLRHRGVAAFAGMGRDLSGVPANAKPDGEAVPRKTPAVTQEEVPTPESAQLSGRVPDVVTLPGEGRSTAEEGEEIAQAAPLPAPAGPANVKLDINLRLRSQGAAGAGHGKRDAAIAGVSMGAFSQPGGRAVSPFGAEFYEPAFTGISYAAAGGKYTITATLDINCPWGTSSGGKTDVPSATDAVVTKANWAAIKADLMPGAASPYKSPRTTYYSQALVERHEKFHGTDDNAWSAGSALPIVKAHIDAGSITPASAAADVTTLLQGARTKLIAENLKYYKGGGASHDAYAGEINAYADGKAAYVALANAVEVQGKSLP